MIKESKWQRMSKNFVDRALYSDINNLLIFILKLMLDQLKMLK